MDYSSDECLESFTRGQMDRMFWVWSLYRKQDEACTDGNKQFELEVRTDQFVGDTTFTLKSTDGVFDWNLDPVANGIPYQLPPNEFVVLDICLDPSRDYVFTMLDSTGNGIDSPGYYTLRYDDRTIREPTSNFGASQSTPFSGAGLAPAPPTLAPAQPTAAPVQPTPSPVALTPAPVQPTPQPVEPTRPPIWDFLDNGNCDNSPQDWHDSDGAEFDCIWYALDSNCASFGHQFANNGLTANQACCVCGGGAPKADTPTQPPVPPPTPAPVVTATPPPVPSPTRPPIWDFIDNGNCDNSPQDWHDSDGEDFDCIWYALDNNCASFGHDFANNGLTANQACCVCGGGVSQ